MLQEWLISGVNANAGFWHHAFMAPTLGVQNNLRTMEDLQTTMVYSHPKANFVGLQYFIGALEPHSKHVLRVCLAPLGMGFL